MGASATVDVAIVGGGFAGLALACGLAQQGREVPLIERQTGTPSAKRRVTLQPNGLAALDRIGALEAVAERGTRATRVRFCTAAGATRALYDFSDLPHPHPYLVTVDPGAFQRALAERLSTLGASPPTLGAEFTDLIREDGAVRGIRYRSADGTEAEVEAGCVVGADGPSSPVRKALAIETRTFGKPDPYVLGIGARPIGAPGDEMVVYCGRGYGDGVVPTEEGAYFWDHVTGDNRAAVEARDLDGWREVYARRHPTAREVAEPLESFDELALVEVRLHRAKRRVATGAALIGEAAGSVHPQSAMGANLALEEAVTLAALLAQRPASSGPVQDEALAAWARARGRRLAAFQAYSLWLAKSFDAPNALWRAVRGTGFALSRIAPLPRWQLRLGGRLGYF